jgi:multiple sugar transport system ATP-binding protein
MNTFKTTLNKKGYKYSVTFFGAEFPIQGEKLEMLKAKNVESREVLLGVRPEHIVLAKEGSKASIPVTILVNEMMGSEYHLTLKLKMAQRLLLEFLQFT